MRIIILFFKTLFIFTILISSTGYSQSFWSKSRQPIITDQTGSLLSHPSDKILANAGSRLFSIDPDSTNWMEIVYLGNSPGSMGSTVDDTGWIYASSGNGGGLNRSTDLGKTWQQLFQTMGSAVDNICANPFRPNIFAGYYTVFGNAAFIRSTDRGTTWQTLSLPKEYCYGFSVGFVSDSIILIGTQKGLIGSFDNGSTWLTSYGLVPSSFINTFLVCKSGKIFAGTAESGMYVSADSGNNWYQVDSSMLGHDNISKIIGTKNNILYAATSTHGVIKSTDEGLNWIESNNGLGNFNIASIATSTNSIIVSARNNDTINLYRSTNDGTSWEMINAPNHLPRITSMCLDSAGGIYLATSVEGLFHSEIGEENFNLLNPSLPYVSPYHDKLFNIAFNKTNKILYLSEYMGYDPYVYHSTDNGKTWSGAVTATDGYWAERGLNVTPSGSVYQLTPSGLFRSTDNGEQFSKVDSGAYAHSIQQICTDSLGRVYAVNGWSVEVSKDDGNTWTTLGNIPVCDLDGPRPALSIFADSPYVYVAVYNCGIYSSSDYGKTWINSSPLPYGYSGPVISSIVGDVDKNIFISFEGRLFMSSNHGVSWALEDSSQESSLIFQLLIGKDNFLYAATSKGILKSNYPVITSVPENISHELPSSFVLNFAYPNPFNPTTTIRYGLPQSSKVVLSVYNTLGQRVALLVDEKQETGYHEVNFNATGLPSGVYFYRLQAGSFSETKKLLLMK